jgi:hypothetical protein
VAIDSGVLAGALRDLLVRRAVEAAPRTRPVRAYNVGGCVRALWYGEHAVPETNPGASSLVMEAGRHDEAWVLPLLAEALGSERFRPTTPSDRVALEPLGHVRCDALWRDGDGDRWRPVDLKSIGASYRLEALRRDGLDRSWRWQLECYCRAYGAEVAYVLPWCRWSCTLAEEYPWVRSDAVWAEILRAVERARGEETPDRPHAPVRWRGALHSPRWPCGWCGWRDECWGGVPPMEGR